MFKTLLARARQGYRTAGFPAEDPAMPPLFRGRPELDPTKCPDGCRECVEACPTATLRIARAANEDVCGLSASNVMLRSLSSVA